MRNPAEHRKESAVEPISTSSGEVRKASRNGKVYSIDTGRIGSAISKIAPQAKKLLAVSDILKDRKQVAKLAKMPRRSQVGVAERVAFGEASSLAEARDILVRSPDFEVDRFNYVLRLALKLTPDEQGRLCERLKRAIARHDGTAAPEVH